MQMFVFITQYCLEMNYQIGLGMKSRINRLGMNSQSEIKSALNRTNVHPALRVYKRVLNTFLVSDVELFWLKQRKAYAGL